MKSIGRVLLTGASLFVSLNLLHAQSAVSLSGTAQPIAEATDATSVMLQALEQVPPLPPQDSPVGGNFYTVQHGQDWPPLPGNVLNLPFWSLGDNFFVLDDRNVDYAELQAEAEALAALEAAAAPMMRMSMMSSLSSSYAYGNPVYLTNMAAVIAYDGSTTASFSIAGGTNFVPYDILMTTNLLSPIDWTWLGIGYTSNNYTFYSQSPDNAFYRLAKPFHTQIIGLGDDTHLQCDVPPGITNAVQVAGGYAQGLALLNDGTVQSWGDNYFTSQPTNLTGVTMIACGWNHNVALLDNGTVLAWGMNAASLGWHLTEVPTNLTNVVVISAQGLHTLALKSDGTVTAWGYNGGGETNVPTGLTNVTAIAAGGQFNLAVSNGCVVAWGFNNYGQCTVPTNLNNAVDVAAGWNHSVALKADGTMVCWGDNHAGQCDVPAGLSNVVAIAAGGFGNAGDYTLALQNDGTMFIWGGGKPVAGIRSLDQVVGITGGANHALALRTGTRTPVVTLQPVDQYQIAGSNVTFTAKGQGLYGISYQWQANGVNLSGATNATLTVTNVLTTSATNYAVLVTDNGGMGSVISDTAYLILVTAPTIISQSPMPTNQVAAYQTNLTFNVVVSAPGQFNGFPLHYQWQFNGANVGANSSNYTFSAANPGTYSVTVTNAAGSASAAWSLTTTYAGSYIDVGTLAYHLSTNAVGYASGYSAINSNMLELSGWVSTTYSGTNIAYLTNAVWSTNCWLHGVQGLSATCIGYSNEYGGKFLITMVSPRHYLRAQHIGYLSTNTLIAFLDTNNVVYWRTAVQEVQVGSSDTDVGILNADLPTTVGFLTVIPTNFSNYLPTNSASYVQGIGLNQSLQWFSQPITFGNPLIAWNSSAAAPFGLGTNWNYTVFSGDSSLPETLLVKNQFVLATHNWHGGLSSPYGDGPNYAYQFDAINQQMHYLSTNNSVGTDYQLTPFSLTNWPTIH